MEEYKRDYYIARIQAGYVPVNINGVRFKINHPSLDIALESQEIYIQAYEEAVEHDVLNNNDLISYLIIQDLWSEQMEEEYQTIVPKHIEYWKIELYKSLLKSKTKKQVRQYLKTAKEEYARLSNIRHQYDYTTIEGYASYIKGMFLISQCATIDDEPVDWNKYNLIQVMSEYHSSILKPEEIRFLSRNTPWSNIWPVMKVTGSMFKEMTIEQQSLITWSNMYDRIHESPDCPSDEVLDDDDMLDGWLLVQKKKREEERQRDETKSAINSKISNADEVFVPAQTYEDAQKIDLLNSARG